MAKIELCNHVKADGNLCESPALRDEDFCFFHLASRERIKRQRRAARRKLPFQLPVLEDSASVQLAIGDTLNALLAGQIDHKTAGLVLYGLQTAASNVRHVTFEILEGTRRYTSYNTEEEDFLEQEIQEEIATEEEEIKKAAEETRKTGLPVPVGVENTTADPALPPKKTPESAANGSAKKQACTTRKREPA